MMSTQVALSDASGPLTNLLQKLSGKDGRRWLYALNKMLRKENPWNVPQIFEVTTAGRTGEESIVTLEQQGFHIGDCAKELLLSKEFVATNGVTYKFALIRGDEFEDDERTNENIRAEAASRGYLEPPVELAPLVCEMFSDEDRKRMILGALNIMHKPTLTSGSSGILITLCLCRFRQDRYLITYNGCHYFRWNCEDSFLFLVPVSN